MHFSQKFKPSSFYENFWMSSLKKKMELHSSITFGTGGGGGGGGTATTTDGKSYYHKSEGFGCDISFADNHNFDEAEIIQLLKTEVENEIIRNGACPSGVGNLGSSGFFIEYTDEDIEGRIEITGGLKQSQYLSLDISLKEISTSLKKTVIERKVARYQPMGAYHVVAFTSDNAEARDFEEKGRRAADKSKERMRQISIKNPQYPSEDKHRTVMYVWTRVSPELKERLKDQIDIDDIFELPAEYDTYDKVYFLNDLMLQMYHESGEYVEVLKTVPASEVAKIPYGPSYQNYYISKEEN